MTNDEPERNPKSEGVQQGTDLCLRRRLPDFFVIRHSSFAKAVVSRLLLAFEACGCQRCTGPVTPFIRRTRLFLFGSQMRNAQACGNTASMEECRISCATGSHA